jgi:regulator of replication initiation timing
MDKWTKNFSAMGTNLSETKEENEKLKEENKKLKEIIIGLGPQGSYLISAEAEIKKLKKEIVEYESVEQSLMKCVREGGGYDEMLPIHYRQESESDDE